MNNMTLPMTDREAELIEELLHAELSSGYTELRRTRNPEYRHRVSGRKALASQILETIEQLRSASSAEPA